MLSGKTSAYILGNCQRKMTSALNRLVFYCDYMCIKSTVALFETVCGLILKCSGELGLEFSLILYERLHQLLALYTTCSSIIYILPPSSFL